MTGFRRRRKEVLAAIVLLSITAAIASLPSFPLALGAARISKTSQAPTPDAASFSFGAAGDIGVNDNAAAALDALAGAETSFFLALGNFAACLPDRLGVTGEYAHKYYFDYPPAAPLARFILIDPAVHRRENKAAYCTKGDTVNCDWLHQQY